MRRTIDFANNNERNRLPTRCIACKAEMGLWNWTNYKRVVNDELLIIEEFESECVFCKRYVHMIYDGDGKPVLNVRDTGYMTKNVKHKW